MECDQCGARRPRTGPCPECGAPPPGGYSSMRQWKDQSRTGQGPAVRGSGAGWGAGPSGSRGSGSGWRAAREPDGWDDEHDYADEPPVRSNPRNRRPGPADYQEIDLERALVPAGNDMLPMDPSMGGAGLPALPGMPTTDDEERMLGMRRPVFIPATGEKRKRKLGTWRVVSGVLSVMLVCVASCGLAGVLGRNQVNQWFSHPVLERITPAPYSLKDVPGTPVATPGAQSKYITNIVTASGVQNYVAVHPTSYFQVNSTVYVVLTVRGITAGQKHVISIQWYLDGQDLGLQSAEHATSYTITQNANVVFLLFVPQPGAGMAKIYIDRPKTLPAGASDSSYLAETINFAVLAPGVTVTPYPPPPTATPSVTPDKTPSPKAYTGGPLAWRDDTVGA